MLKAIKQFITSDEFRFQKYVTGLAYLNHGNLLILIMI